MTTIESHETAEEWVARFGATVDSRPLRDLLRAMGPEARPLGSLAYACRMSPSPARRRLGDLQSLGLAEEMHGLDEGDLGYRLTPAGIAIAEAVAKLDEAADLVRPPAPAPAPPASPPDGACP